MTTRRAFALELMGSMLAVSLVRAVARAGVVAGNVGPVVEGWLPDLDQLCLDLRDAKLSQPEWQRQIDARLSRVDRADLLRAIDYQHLLKRVNFAGAHEYQTRLTLPVGDALNFSPWFFAIAKGGAVVPHGHHNLVTMHMILDGQPRARQFERVRRDGAFMIIQPTLDAVLAPGAVSTISDEHNNVHWFTAREAPVFTFNMQLVIDPTVPAAGRDYIDPEHGEKLGDGSIRAPRLGEREAYDLYGEGQ